MEKKLSPLGLLILSSFLILSFGCTAEKAEAIKIAAEKFREEAVLAIQKVHYLFEQSLTSPWDSTDTEMKRIAGALEKEEVINAKKISALIEERNIGSQAKGELNQEFRKIETRYYQFAGMFRSLPQGSFFAREAVKRSEKQAIHLTLDLIHYASILKNYPVQFTARRVLIQERIAEAKQMKDPDARNGFLNLVAGDILKLRDEEETAKQEAILQCLKAAESGRMLSDLIRNYENMKVEDILLTLRSSLGIIADLGLGQKDLVSLMESYQSVESGIRQDPYWKEVLALEIPK
ncbi:MAG: hypothetical protein HXY24_18095 [Rubrivivax sp.]|nr:hypothetical protein [Rubrivivax sp.]